MPSSFRSRTDLDTVARTHSKVELRQLLHEAPLSRRTSSIMLERYVTEEDASPSAVICDVGRTITSVQSRQRSNLSITSGNPAARRPDSPIIRAELLRDCFIQDPAYPDQLRNAVESAARALNARKRNREGYGLIELYKQSSKDPGSAEQLDALLRNKATERQTLDFRTYIERVYGLIELPAVTLGPEGTTEKSVRGKRKRRTQQNTTTASPFRERPTSPYVPIVEACTETTRPKNTSCPTVHEQCESSHKSADRVGATEERKLAAHETRRPHKERRMSSRRMGMVGTRGPESADLAIYPVLTRCPTIHEQCESLYKLADMVGALEEQESAAHQARRRHGRRRDSRQRRRAGTAPLEFPELSLDPVLAAPFAQTSDNVLTNDPIDTIHASETTQPELVSQKPQQERSIPPPLQHHEVQLTQSSTAPLGHQSRRRMRKDRMFSGASGPVYSETLWEVPNNRSLRARG